MRAASQQPQLTVVVAVYNMKREAPRTLRTLTAHYQDVPRDTYELIVVENGSSEPLGETTVRSIDAGFQYRWFDSPHPSPAAGINAAVRESKGSSIALLIDGARMLSPGFLRYSMLALRAYQRPIISTLGCHLGPNPQQHSVLHGYDSVVEDQLLNSVPWQRNGYSLFRISCLAGSSKYGILAPLAESNALVMPRQLFDELGGYDERFVSPGGGLVNLDFYQRAQALMNVQLVTLLGEASFHQIHGGASTGSVDRWANMTREYETIRGRAFEPYPHPWLRPDFLGQVRSSFRPWLSRAQAELEPLLKNRKRPLYTRRGHVERFESCTSQRVIVVLGMHRSGTSLLAGTLQEAGLVLGDVVTSAPHNLKGNRESIPIRILHDDLLASAGGSWSDPPDEVSWSPLHQAMRDQLIAHFSQEPLWGFKDPRSLFCIDGWLESLPDLETVAIVRSPIEVALSLQARNKMSLESGLELWHQYNLKLLHWLNRYKTPLLHFTADPDYYRHQVIHLIQDLNLPRQLSANELTFFDPSLRHQAEDSLQLIPREIDALYNTLLERVTVH